jgi:hypothetical protein
LVARSTEHPRNTSRRPPRIEPRTSSAKLALPSAPRRKRSGGCLAALSESQSEVRSLRDNFVKPDEVAQSHREVHVFGGIERIKSQYILKSGDDNRKAQGIKTRIKKYQIVGQRR